MFTEAKPGRGGGVVLPEPRVAVSVTLVAQEGVAGRDSIAFIFLSLVLTRDTLASAPAR